MSELTLLTEISREFMVDFEVAWNCGRFPTAKLSSPKTVIGKWTSPRVASFSSRGPSTLSPTVLKVLPLFQYFKFLVLTFKAYFPPLCLTCPIGSQIEIKVKIMKIKTFQKRLKNLI